MINENERLYKIWDAIRDAKSDMHYVTTRRMALLKLRDMIGPDAIRKQRDHRPTSRTGGSSTALIAIPTVHRKSRVTEPGCLAGLTFFNLVNFTG